LKYLLFANTGWYLANFRLPLIKAIIKDGHQVVLVAPPGIYHDRLIESGAIMRTLKISRRGANPLFEFRTILQLIRIYKQEKPDLCHHFTVKGILYGSFAAIVSRVSRRVNSFTGLGYLFTSGQKSVRLLRYVIWVCLRILLSGPNVRVIVQNKDDEALLLGKRLVDRKKLFLISGSGINLDRFHPRIRESKPRSEVTVLMASRLLADKGVFEFCEAARIVGGYDQTELKAKFLLAGSSDTGNPSAISPRKLDDLKRQGSVEIIDAVDNILDLLAIADVVVLPSYREGLPRILLEAFSCGIPVVATDVPGCRELVQHGGNGFLVEKGNVEELARAMNALIQDVDLREKFGIAGRETVKNKYDEHTILAQTKSVYSTLAGYSE